jgi:hypothetical protein
MQEPAGDPAARERVLEVVPGLDDLIERGVPGDQLQSVPLAVDGEQAWLLWFVRREHGLVIAVPVAGLRADAVQDGLERCNEHNSALQWSVLSVSSWEGDEIVSLSVRMPLPPTAEDVWAMVGGAMQHVLEAAGLARERFADLVEA